jgi:RWD domain
VTDGHHADEDEEPPTIVLQVQYPEEYPDVAPHLEISSPPNAPKYAFLDVQEDRANLLESLESTVEENLGIAMVFTLVSALKDSAELLVSERQKAKQALKDFESQKAEEAENAKFHGTPVTRETFLAWREKFVEAMEEEEKRKKEEQEAEDSKKRRGGKDEVKLTGRQIWETGLAGKVEEDDEGEDALVGVDKLKIGA